jgi:hypothetical protein
LNELKFALLQLDNGIQVAWPVRIQPFGKRPLEGDQLSNRQVQHITDGFIETGAEPDLLP